MSGFLDNTPIDPNTPENLGFVDVDGDGIAAPRDALLVINYLNERALAAVAAEAESDLDEQLTIEQDSPEAFQALAGAALLRPDNAATEPVERAVDEALQLNESTLRSPATELGDSRSLFEDPRIVDELVEDSITEIAAHARKTGTRFPLLKDLQNRVADQFQATRTPQVFVLDKDRRIRYYGRVDAQYTFGSGVGLA